MKIKHIAAMLAVFATVALMMRNAYATYDSHTHTGNGTIDTWLSCSPHGSHKLRAFAPSIGVINAYTWKSGVGFFAEVTVRDGKCATVVHDCSADNVLFSSWTSQQTAGTGYAYLADANNANLPNCTGS